MSFRFSYFLFLSLVPSFVSPRNLKKNRFSFFRHDYYSYQPHDDFFSDEFNVLEEVKAREREREKERERRGENEKRGS